MIWQLLLGQFYAMHQFSEPYRFHFMIIIELVNNSGKYASLRKNGLNYLKIFTNLLLKYLQNAHLSIQTLPDSLSILNLIINKLTIMSENKGLGSHTSKLKSPNVQINDNHSFISPELQQYLENEVIKLFQGGEAQINHAVTTIAKIVLQKISKHATGLEQSTKPKQPWTQSLKNQAPTTKDEQYNKIVYPSRKTKWVRNISNEQQKLKYEQRKYIAFSFCQHGINFHYITQKYPKMEAKTYRCIVEAVNNETVNQIVDFLRYECNIQIERLNRDQKRSIRTQLTKIKDWLGNRDPQQLQTFYKFIYRHYDKQLEIKFEDALKLYKTIIQIIKSPFVNVLEAAEAARGNEGERPIEQEKAMIILFIKHKDENKVSDQLCQKYGYDVRWSLHSVKVRLRHFLQASFDKLISTVKEDQRSLYVNFLNGKRRELLQQKIDIDLRIAFYSYYLQKTTSSPKIKNLLLKLQDFFKFYEKDASQVQFPKTQQSGMTDLTHPEIVKSQIMQRTINVGLQKTQFLALEQTEQFILDQTRDGTLIKKEEDTAAQDSEQPEEIKIQE